MRKRSLTFEVYMSFNRNQALDKLIIEAKKDKKILQKLDYDQLFRLSKYLIELNESLNDL